MRKTIYVPNEKVWVDVQKTAGSMNLSVSQYLLGGEHMPRKSQLDRMESKIDLLIPKGKFGKPMIDDSGYKEAQESSNKANAEMLADSQAKLDAVRKGRDIKRDKIASAAFNPQPKGAK
jgi:hypothetical protein